MIRIVSRALLLGCLGWSVQSAWGVEPDQVPACPSVQGCGTTCCSLLAGCEDDYHRKPLPALPCLPPCGQPDDYCRKPCPVIRCLRYCGQPDDYCRKPLPRLCRPLNPEHFTCGPSCCPGAQCGSPGGGPVSTETRGYPVSQGR